MHRHFCTSARLHRNPFFAQKLLDTEKHHTKMLLQAGALRADACAQKCFYTQIDLHPESFATFTQKSVPQKNLYTQKLGDTDADTDKGILRRKKAA